jgi:hypothetical protein
MISARVKSINLEGAIRKAGKAERRVRTMVTMAAREDTKPYVPYVTGALRQSAEANSNLEQGRLVYGGGNIRYARAQYYGLPGKTWPGTCMQWFEPSKAANIDSWIKIAEKEARSA